MMSSLLRGCETLGGIGSVFHTVERCVILSELWQWTGGLSTEYR